MINFPPHFVLLCVLSNDYFTYLLLLYKSPQNLENNNHLCAHDSEIWAKIIFVPHDWLRSLIQCIGLGC